MSTLMKPQKQTFLFPVSAMEIVGPSKRTVVGVAFQAFFAVGVMLVAFWGFLIKDQFWLQVVYGLHSLLLIGHWW